MQFPGLGTGGAGFANVGFWGLGDVLVTAQVSERGAGGTCLVEGKNYLENLVVLD